MQDLHRKSGEERAASQPSTESVVWAEDDLEDLEDLEPAPVVALTGLNLRRLIAGLLVLLALAVMAIVPPLINGSRYRRQIAASIGASLGRPVRIGSVSLNLLPMPGFRLENFVVDEDPAFGDEPVIRASQVRVTLRMSSLWRRRVEFSRIVLDDPSVNLVHLPNGQWNLESILLQASRMPAAPTDQKAAGASPRFPYIEATGARVNVKLGLEKMPISLTDAEFALWLPEPRQWHLRLAAHPARTDGPATDTGIVRVEGTLGQASSLATVRVDLNAEWSAAPLGAVSRVLLGRDAGLRGAMTLNTTVRGVIGDNVLQSTLTLLRVRRADFVPPRLLDAEISCTAQATELFHNLQHIHCQWPARAETAGSLVLGGEVQDVLNPASAFLQARFTGVPDTSLLDALRAATSRISPGLMVAGDLDGELSCCAAGRSETGDDRSTYHEAGLHGEFAIPGFRLMQDGAPIVLNADVKGELQGSRFVLQPVPLALGGKEPAMLDLQGDDAGYAMHLAGSVLRSRLVLVASALPPFGDGLADVLLGRDALASADPAQEQPIRIDLVSARRWGAGQTWRPVAVVERVAGHRARRSRLRSSPNDPQAQHK